MASQASHGLVVQGSGSTGATDTTIGSIELPTSSTNWVLNAITGVVVRATATAAEAIVGHMRINSTSGDITPDPAPSLWPLAGSGSLLGSTAPVSMVPIHKYDLNLQAAGKADIDLIGNVAISVAVAPIFVIGLQFAPTIPVKTPFLFSNRVRTTVTAVARAQVGTITLSEKAKRIIGIMGYIRQDGVMVAAQELVGFFDLASEDVDLVPSQWLFNECYGAGLSTLIGSAAGAPPMPHVVDIPVPGGARIDCFVTLNTLVTNGADVEIFIMYE